MNIQLLLQTLKYLPLFIEELAATIQALKLWWVMAHQQTVSGATTLKPAITRGLHAVDINSKLPTPMVASPIIPVSVGMSFNTTTPTGSGPYAGNSQAFQSDIEKEEQIAKTGETANGN